MKVLLDTNAYTALMADRGDIAERIRRSEGVIVSAVVLGELLFGFRNGARYERNRAQLDAFIANRFVETIPVTLSTAERFGLIAAQLRRGGTPLPSNDIWVAAHAMETGAELLSFDSHFARVDGLLWTHFNSE